MDVLEFFVSMKVNPSILVLIFTIAQIFWFSDTNFSLFPSLSFKNLKVPLEQVSDLCDFLGLFCQNCLKLCRLIFFAKLRNTFFNTFCPF